jgi:magnesium-transporting ATPase (P-type)
MGKIGTDIAKEASNIVLKDDDLNGLVTCIEWGRNIYLILQRFVFL